MADISVTVASVLSTTPTRYKRGVIGGAAAITQGQLVALDSTGLVVLCDADHASEENRIPIGVALTAGSPGQPIAYQDNDDTFACGATVVVGVAYFNSTTAGGIQPMADPTTGAFLGLVGYGQTTSTLKLALSHSDVALAANPTP